MVKQTAYAHLPEAAGDAEKWSNESGVSEKCVTTRLPAANSDINLPPDALAEMRRQNTNPRAAMQVDGFRRGIFGRPINLVTGRRR